MKQHTARYLLFQSEPFDNLGGFLDIVAELNNESDFKNIMFDLFSDDAIANEYHILDMETKRSVVFDITYISNVLEVHYNAKSVRLDKIDEMFDLLDRGYVETIDDLMHKKMFRMYWSSDELEDDKDFYRWIKHVEDNIDNISKTVLEEMFLSISSVIADDEGIINAAWVGLAAVIENEML